MPKIKIRNIITCIIRLMSFSIGALVPSNPINLLHQNKSDNSDVLYNSVKKIFLKINNKLNFFLD